MLSFFFLMGNRSIVGRMQGHAKAPDSNGSSFDWNSLIGDTVHDDELYQRSMEDIEQVWIHDGLFTVQHSTLCVCVCVCVCVCMYVCVRE